MSQDKHPQALADQIIVGIIAGFTIFKLLIYQTTTANIIALIVLLAYIVYSIIQVEKIIKEMEEDKKDREDKEKDC